MASHPKDLAWHTGLRSTLSLTGAGVASLALSSEEISRACARVNDGGLLDDMTIFEELFDMLAGVGVSDLRLFCGVEPDLTLADTSDWKRKTIEF